MFQMSQSTIRKPCFSAEWITDRWAAQVQRKRILFLIPGEGGGSSMVFALRQADSLRSLGFEVYSFHLKSRTSPLLLVREWVRFRRELKRIRASVVHAHFGTVTASFGVLAAGRIPLVITYRGSDLNPSPGPLRTRIRALTGRLLSQCAALGAQRIICVSDQLKQRLWWGQEKTVVLPSGVNPDVFYPRSKSEARLELGWPLHERVVLFNAGHNPRIKRVDLAYAAMAQARKRTAHLRMEMMDGTTPPDRVPLLMNACDCLLLTSDSEGSPTVVQEALACNLPVVSVEVGDIRQRLTDVDMCRISPRDPSALADAILDIVALGRRSDGRRQIAQFCLQRIAHELAGIYAEAAGGNYAVWSAAKEETV
jgi:teichuronic acid biosynthesis glycosyltransferase TuaC